MKLHLIFSKFLAVGILLLIGISAKADTYYVRPAANTTSWANFPAEQVITTNSLSIDGTSTYYLAPGTYTASSINVTIGQIYGGFSGNETSIVLNDRQISDKDGNGITEPWEFSNEAIITTSTPSYTFTEAGISTGNRLLMIQGTGGEVNGVTITDFNYLLYAGPICLGLPSASPSAANNVLGKEGILRLCTVKKIKSAIGIVMSTNKYSIIDRCLIESNVITGPNTGGAVYLNACGGTVTGSVIRNNAALGTWSRGAGVYATSLSGTDMDAIVENSVIYNNYAINGSAIRGDAQSNKRGIQVINCTVVNNKTNNTPSTSYASIELITSGTVANSIVVGDPSAELRIHNVNNYIVNTVYGEKDNGSNAIYGSDNASGKVVSDLDFINPTTFTGVMIPDFTSPFVQADYDAIQHANFKVNSSSSVAVSNPGLKSLASSYLIEGTGTAINLTATIPTTDMSGFVRIGDYTLGAYQATLDVAKENPLTISQDATLAAVTVAAGGQLTINNGVTATIGSLTLESDASGTATMLNSGTFTGTVTAQQYLGSARNWYVSSPVSNATSPANNVDYYYEYVEAGNNNTTGQPGSSTAYWKGLSNGTLMDVGKGYIAKANAGTTIQFSGTPNNGNITTTFNLTRDDAKGKGFNLVGNPYPSYIDWSLVATANPNLSKTFYFRSKNTNLTSTYTFASYNGLLNEMVSSNGTPNTTITRFIPPTQAFWVRVNTGTSATKMYFNNNMRAHRDDNGNLLKAPKADNRTRLRLQLISGSEADETMICTDANADNGFDMYDSPKMMNNSAVTPDLYTKVGDERLVINGLNAITENLEFPLGFSLNTAASLKLKATEISNFPTGTQIFLLDKVESVQTELLPETEYSFSTTTATTNNESRFSLIFRVSGSTTRFDNTAKLNTQVYVNAANQITIIAPEKATYSIYNTVGIRLENGVVNSKLETRNSKFGAGVYFVSLSVNGQNEIQKIVIR